VPPSRYLRFTGKHARLTRDHPSGLRAAAALGRLFPAANRRGPFLP